MSEIHLKQPGFTYSANALFTKNKETIQKIMQTRNTNYIYRNDLDKNLDMIWCMVNIKI